MWKVQIIELFIVQFYLVIYHLIFPNTKKLSQYAVLRHP
jgi:hypothetical protein